MQKWVAFLLVFALLWACKRTESLSQNQDKAVLAFHYQKMPPQLAIHPKAAAIVETWDAFKAFTESIGVLYKARNPEDVSLAVDDLIEKEKLLARSTYPPLFNTSSVKSRQRVLRTYLLKTEHSLLEKQPVTEPTVAMLEAYNALRQQLNRVANSQLDEALLRDTP